MKTTDLLNLLRERDIQLWVKGNRLCCNAPPGALTAELRNELRERKGEIVGFLQFAQQLNQPFQAVVPIQPRGTATPIFAVGGHNGDIFCFRALARYLGEDQPFFGLQPPGLDGANEPLTRVEDFAACFASQIRATCPDGPCIIAGYCAGGTIAFELARQLCDSGVEVSSLALFGSPFHTSFRYWARFRQRIGYAGERLALHARALSNLPLAGWSEYLAERVNNVRAERSSRRNAPRDAVANWRDKVGHATLAAIRHYVPKKFAGRVNLFWPNSSSDIATRMRWQTIAPDIEVYFGPPSCNGAVMLTEAYAATFAELFQRSALSAESIKAPPIAPVVAPSTNLESNASNANLKVIDALSPRTSGSGAATASAMPALV